MALTGSESVSRPSVEAWAVHHLRTEGLAKPLRSVLKELVEILEAERRELHEVFLSVVIRTQLRRWEQLKDALLCLHAQTDQNFEVMLMLHDVEDDLVAKTHELVGSYPSNFAKRIFVKTVQGGGRVRPLAKAVQHLRGEYVAFYDDDDLLMANWVEAFHEGAIENPGKVIRSNVAVQMNRLEKWNNGSLGQRSVGLAMPEYAESFSLIDHLERNHTPFMGFAFPASFFTLWGQRFDEDLSVCEDWDVALRAVGLMGVSSSTQLTAIYRRWEDAQTSYTDHHREEWAEAAFRVRTRMASTPFFMPDGSSDDAIELLAREHRTQQEMAVLLGSTFWRVTSPFRRVVERLRRGRYGNI